MSSTRLLVLPSLALAAVVTVAPGASATAPPAVAPAALTASSPTASAAPCGRAAVPATYETVHHPATSRTVPAQTHSEWRWQREVSTVEVEVSRTVAAAARSYSWSRVVEHLEAQYSRTVIDRAYVPGSPEEGHFVTEVVTPAVTEERWLYEQHETGDLRWRDTPDWNPGEGWNVIGSELFELVPAVTRQVWEVTRPAVPEVAELSHVETEWVSLDEAAPAGFAPTGETRVVGSTVERVTLPEGEVPEGAGWTQGAASETAAVTEERWIPAGDPTPDGFAPTGAIRDGVPTLEITSVPSPTSPAGDGWEVVAGSELVVTDVEETEEVVTAAWEEQVLVTPGVPATAPCAADPAEDAADPAEDAGDSAEDSGGQPDLGGVIEGTPADAAPVDDQPVDAQPVDAQPVDAAPADAAAEESPEGSMLPATGAEMSPWPLAMGLTSLLAGLALVRGRRRVS